MPAKRSNPMHAKYFQPALRGPQLRAARKLRGMTLMQLAKATGVAYSTLHRHEVGRLRIKEADVEIYAAALVMSVADLKEIQS